MPSYKIFERKREREGERKGECIHSFLKAPSSRFITHLYYYSYLSFLQIHLVLIIFIYLFFYSNGYYVMFHLLLSCNDALHALCYTRFVYLFALNIFLIRLFSFLLPCMWGIERLYWTIRSPGTITRAKRKIFLDYLLQYRPPNNLKRAYENKADWRSSPPFASPYMLIFTRLCWYLHI